MSMRGLNDMVMRILKSDSVITSVADKLHTPISGFMAFFGVVNLDTIYFLVGIVGVAIGGYVKWDRNKRERELHELRMRGLLKDDDEKNL